VLCTRLKEEKLANCEVVPDDMIDDVANSAIQVAVITKPQRRQNPKEA
jgi:hypothetical protein